MTGMVSSTVFHFAAVARVGIDDVHRVRLIFSNVQAGLGGFKVILFG